MRVETARVEQVRAAAERRLRRLEHRLAEVADTGGLSDIDIVEKSAPAAPFLACRVTTADLDEAGDLIAEVFAAGTHVQHTGPVTIVAHDRFFDTEQLDIELGFPIANPASLTLRSGRRLTVGRLPAVERMPSIVHAGDPSTGHRRRHRALGLWLASHDCHLAGPGREILHNPAGATFEIQYPIAGAA